jgi:hypothetical protein
VTNASPLRKVLFLNFRARRKFCCKRLVDCNREYLANAVSLHLEYTFESRAYRQPKDSMEMAAMVAPKSRFESATGPNPC